MGSTISNVWRLAARTIDLSRRPCVMGILNVTPDSFSDGGRYADVDSAIERALAMEAEGADIIDVGAESTRPFAPPVSAEEELRRILPVIVGLRGRLNIPISVDTYKAEVACETIRAGAEIINDISALTFDGRMMEVVADSGAGVVMMHTRGRPAEMLNNTKYTSLVPEIIDFLRNAVTSATAAGIDRERIVIDPGIGFGKDAAGNVEILRRLADLAVLGRPVLIGTSRKSFIGKILGREVGDRTFGTAATVVFSLLNGASIFRVHDVRETRDLLDMTAVLTGFSTEHVSS